MIHFHFVIQPFSTIVVLWKSNAKSKNYRHRFSPKIETIDNGLLIGLELCCIVLIEELLGIESTNLCCIYASKVHIEIAIPSTSNNGTAKTTATTVSISSLCL